MVYVTRHCEERIRGRLSTLVSMDEVMSKIEKLNPRVGQTWVLIKRLERPVYIPCNTQDGAVNGDTIWAVVRKRDKNDSGAVTTVFVRRHGQTVKADHVVK